jgi:hypothetical protein
MKKATIPIKWLFGSAVMCLATSALATPISPGMSGALTQAPAGYLNNYTLIATTGVQTYHSCSPNVDQTICGQYEEAVYQNNTNHTLDFVYQFSNNYSGDGVDSAAVSHYNDKVGPWGWATNAYYTNTLPAGFGGLGAPGPSGNASSVLESANAGTISFDYNNGLETGVSSYLIVQTFANNYEPGVFAVQDSLNYNSHVLGLPAFQPVPEPGFYGLLAIGLGALVAVRFRRKQTA